MPSVTSWENKGSVSGWVLGLQLVGVMVNHSELLHLTHCWPSLVTEEALLVIASSFPDIAYFIISKCRIFLTSLFLYVRAQELYVNKFVGVHWPTVSGKALNEYDSTLNILNKLLGNIEYPYVSSNTPLNPCAQKSGSDK